MKKFPFIMSEQSALTKLNQVSLCIVYPLKKKHVMITANFVSKLRPEIDTFSNN